MDLYESVKLLRVSLLRQQNGSEDFNITILSKIFSKFAIVLKIFESFCPPILTIITGRRKFLSLADGLHDRTQESKNGNFSFKFCIFLMN